MREFTLLHIECGTSRFIADLVHDLLCRSSAHRNQEVELRGNSPFSMVCDLVAQLGNTRAHNENLKTLYPSASHKHTDHSAAKEVILLIAWACADFKVSTLIKL